MGKHQADEHLHSKDLRREKEAENLFEEMGENFPNLGKETNIQFQIVHRVPNKMKPKRPTLRHIEMKK